MRVLTDLCNNPGDGWSHDVVVEQFLQAEPGVRYPRCLTGRRQCPPEDVGGIGGYENFFQAMADTKHPEHEDDLAWIGASFDPETCDLEGINRQLQRIR